MLPKSDRLLNQIVGLERRTARSGRDSIDHGPGGHDDLANCVAGVADLTLIAARRDQIPQGDIGGPPISVGGERNINAGWEVEGTSPDREDATPWLS